MVLGINAFALFEFVRTFLNSERSLTFLIGPDFI